MYMYPLIVTCTCIHLFSSYSNSVRLAGNVLGENEVKCEYKYSW